MGGDVLFLFGTVSKEHNAQLVRDLKRYLDQKQGMRWIQDTVSELPGYWDLLLQKVPSIGSSRSGRQILEDFDCWLRQGFTTEENPVIEKYTVLMPLAITVGLAEFWQYVEEKSPGFEDPLARLLRQHRADQGSSMQSIGMCAGILTAFAVASSHGQRDFEKYGAVAIRLAMILGAVADAQASYGKPKSYVAAWHTPEQGEHMKRTVSLLYPKAYISVWYDEGRVTITTTAEWVQTTLLSQLQGAGLTVVETIIQGYIHSPTGESKRIADSICELCEATSALQFAELSELALQTYANDGHGYPVVNGSLHEVAVRGSISKPCRWYETLSALPVSHVDSSQTVITFGPDRCVPPSLLTSLGARSNHVSNLRNYCTASTTSITSHTSTSSITQSIPSTVSPPVATTAFDTSIQPPIPKSEDSTSSPKLESSGPEKTTGAEEQQAQSGEPSCILENAIAVVGMAIKTAGADDVDEFYHMIQSGVVSA